MKVVITVVTILLGIALHLLGVPYLVNAVSSVGIDQLNGGNASAAAAGAVSSAGFWFNAVLGLVVAAVLYLTWKKK
jgi:hypothetical protein